MCFPIVISPDNEAPQGAGQSWALLLSLQDPFEGLRKALGISLKIRWILPFETIFSGGKESR